MYIEINTWIIDIKGAGVSIKTLSKSTLEPPVIEGSDIHQTLPVLQKNTFPSRNHCRSKVSAHCIARAIPNSAFRKSSSKIHPLPHRSSNHPEAPRTRFRDHSEETSQAPKHSSFNFANLGPQKIVKKRGPRFSQSNKKRLRGQRGPKSILTSW